MVCAISRTSDSRRDTNKSPPARIRSSVEMTSSLTLRAFPLTTTAIRGATGELDSSFDAGGSDTYGDCMRGTLSDLAWRRLCSIQDNTVPMPKFCGRLRGLPLTDPVQWPSPKVGLRTARSDL